MRVMVDVNVVLDVLLKRQPWADEAVAVWEANRTGRIDGCLVATAITNLYYVARRLVGAEKALNSVCLCLAAFEVIAVDRASITRATQMAGADFEDNVLMSAALFSGVDAVVTRDAIGFALSPVAIYSPSQLLDLLR